MQQIVSPEPAGSVSDALRLTFMEAIAFKRVVSTSYNGNTVRLAPHIMFQRHGDLFVGALNVDKAWRDDDERRLGQFKLTGLKSAELLEEVFEPLAGQANAPPRADDTLVLAV